MLSSGNKLANNLHRKRTMGHQRLHGVGGAEDITCRKQYPGSIRLHYTSKPAPA